MVNAKIGSIQILRALAVCMVICYHFGLPVKNGFIGVDVFFVISGFVITHSLFKRKSVDFFHFVASFYKRRIIRLFPAFFACYIVTLFLSIALISPNQGEQQQILKTSLFALFGLSNYALPRYSGSYFQPEGWLNPFLHTWSLSVEEQFYLIFPVIYFLLISRRIKYSNFKFLFLSFLCIASMLAIYFRKIGEIGLPENEIYFSTVARLWEFVLGVLAALLFRERQLGQRFSSVRVDLIRIGATSLLIWCFFSQLNFESNLFLLLVPNLATFIILLTLEPQSSVYSTKTHFYIFRVFRLIGDYSYSIYLWHWPVWVILNVIFPNNYSIKVLLASLFTTILSVLSFNLIERRNLSRFASKSNFRVIRFFVVRQFTGALVSIFALFGVQKGWGQEWALNSHLIMRENCDVNTQKKMFCVWNESGKDTIVLLGDSMAWAIGNSIIEFSRSNGYKLESYTRNACPPTHFSSRPNDDCGRWQSDSIKRILQIRPKLVVLASSFGYSDTVNIGLGKLISELGDSLIPTVVILPPPGGDNFSSRRAFFFAPGNSNRTRPRTDIDFLIKLGVKNTLGRDLIFFNPSDYLCSQKQCVIARDGHDFYTYGGHLSPYGARYLDKYLWPQMKRIVES
ncbi:MAG: acyltransferase [Actinomycetales bacterium]|nr:acyltransferase [Actinomycetales bacterium]